MRVNINSLNKLKLAIFKSLLLHQHLCFSFKTTVTIFELNQQGQHFKFDKY